MPTILVGWKFNSCHCGRVFGLVGVYLYRGIVVMVSLFKLHSFICRARWGMSRLGRMYCLSLDCGVF